MKNRISYLIAGLVSAASMVHGAPAVKPAAPAPAAPAAPAGPALSPEASAFFEAKVRPLLAKSCYSCHSIEQGKSKGSLTLDTRGGWEKGGDTGSAIIPGSPEKSLVIKAISYADPDLQMPPKGERLSPGDVEVLTQWVKMGAPDPRLTATAKLTGLTDKARSHWAYQPVKPVEVPAVKDKGWVKTPVDAFILAKLEQAGMTPSKAAMKEVLLRRASFDLIGLPPTPEEIHAFVIDRSPNAFEKVIDRLLASPHYGERWGRYWLDTARYADTSGSESKTDDYRYAYAWTYRDYVIASVNEDKPYDQFLREQIAADLLPDADKHPDTLAALGFLTVGKRFVNNNDTIDERIDTVSKATMALTVSCARCHDHKFDPIPTADYYSLHGIFTSTIEPTEKPVVGLPPTSVEVADFKKKLAELEAKNRDKYFEVVEERTTEIRKKAAGYILSSFYSRGPTKDLVKKVKAVKEYNLNGDANGALITAIKFDRKDDSIWGPLFWFSEIPQDDYAKQAKDVLEKIAKGEGKKTLNPLVVAAFKKVSPGSLKNLQDVAEVYGKLFASIDGKAKEYIAANHKNASVGGFDASLVQLIEVPLKVEPASAMTTEHVKEIFTKVLLGEGAYSTFYFAAINELELTHRGAPGRAMAVADVAQPKDSPVFIRGDAANKGKLTPRQFLEILSGPNRQPFKVGSGRLELAKAIATKDNPLTARVMVNRLWMHHFGEGFVRTPDDMGVQSEPPSHPELIDYLAGQFVENGWSLKKMHKLIMMSSAYQQISDTNPTYQQKDPYNRLLWRTNLRRLDFEAIRDTMLQFTGKLDRTVGGRPVNLVDEPYSFRRSVYGYVDRGNLPELMSEFDFGDPNRPNSKRATTIVPQQALFLMNSPMSADVARKVCSRKEFTGAKDDYARVKALYEVLYQRDPRQSEVRMAADFYNAHVLRGPSKGPTAVAVKPKAVAKETAKDQKMSSNGKSAIQNEGETVERTPLTIWEQYAQALLFSNEIAYVN